MTEEKAKAVVDEIFSLYENFGKANYIGEPISQLEHMVQTAQLAEAEGCDEEVILAAFFHDIGHLLEFVHRSPQWDGIGMIDHEKIGAMYLREKGFSEKICRLVQNHVQAKRYLTYKHCDYFKQLSSASKITLSYQGGVMDETEAERFEADTAHQLYVRFREWDDQAKVMNRSLPDLTRYREMAVRRLLMQEIVFA